MSTGWNRLSAEALRHEVEHCRDLLARHVELLDNLVDAEILEVLDDGGDGQRVPLNAQAPLTLPGMLSTAGHWDQSSDAMVGTPYFRLRQTGLPVTGLHAEPRSPSRRLNQPWIWFQLLQMRVTSLRSRFSRRLSAGAGTPSHVT